MSISQWTHPATGETRFYIRAGLPKKTYVNQELKVVSLEPLTTAQYSTIEILLLRFVKEIAGFWVATAPEGSHHTEEWLQSKLESTQLKYREQNK